MSKDQFEQVIEGLQEELRSIRANQATPSLVENITIQAYNTQMKIQEVATISVPEPQMLVIQPWDKTIMKDLESGLRDCEYNFSPVVDGDVVRISFPPLTEEKRKELVKLMNEKIENGRIALRKIREDELKQLKQQEKDGEISEDDYFRQEKEMQQLIDTYNQQIKDIAEKKEKELMTV